METKSEIRAHGIYRKRNLELDECDKFRIQQVPFSTNSVKRGLPKLTINLYQLILAVLLSIKQPCHERHSMIII